MKEKDTIEYMIRAKCMGYREWREFGDVDTQNYGNEDYWLNAPIKVLTRCPICETINKGCGGICKKCSGDIKVYWSFMIWSANGNATINVEQYIKNLEKENKELKNNKIGFHLPDDYYDNEVYNSDYENK